MKLQLALTHPLNLPLKTLSFAAYISVLPHYRGPGGNSAGRSDIKAHSSSDKDAVRRGKLLISRRFIRSKRLDLLRHPATWFAERKGAFGPRSDVPSLT